MASTSSEYTYRQSLNYPTTRNRILLKELLVHYRVHNSPPPLPILSQINKVQATPFCIFNIYKVVQIWPGLFVCKQVTVFPGHIWTTLYFNIILLSTPTPSKQHLSFTRSYQKSACISILPHTCHMPGSSNPPWLDHPNTWWKAQIIKFLIINFSPLSCYFLSLSAKHFPQNPILETQVLYVPRTGLWTSACLPPHLQSNGLCDVRSTVLLGLIKYEPRKWVVCERPEQETLVLHRLYLCFEHVTSQTDTEFNEFHTNASIRKYSHIFWALKSCGQLWS
jgi:hypothetical protein